ncbi:uncharacterized protein LOC142587461 isoform X2 [Dermacentor variabilis]|uniref:uncharacterized protein LOC142587461 isoform X2 n=1 Tax=Dermacentor variabilis TaxID=34621 RepID=UPI003F5CB14F
MDHPSLKAPLRFESSTSRFHSRRSPLNCALYSTEVHQPRRAFDCAHGQYSLCKCNPAAVALHTFEKVWVRYRSYNRRTLGHEHTCLYNEVRYQGHRSYLFAQHYEVDWKWKSQQIYGRLFQGRGGEAIMRLSQRPGHPHCEMWVWGDHVRKHVPQCQLAYKRHCNTQYPVYTHRCGQP